MSVNIHSIPSWEPCKCLDDSRNKFPGAIDPARNSAEIGSPVCQTPSPNGRRSQRVRTNQRRHILSMQKGALVTFRD